MIPDSLFALLKPYQEHKNRTAFLAALIMERCTKAEQYQAHTTPPTTAYRRLPRFNPHHAMVIANALVSIAERIKSHAENNCNREVTPVETRRDAANQERFRAIAREIGFQAKTSGDPRGACAFLIDPEAPKDGDGWGDGWSVYR